MRKGETGREKKDGAGFYVVAGIMELYFRAKKLKTLDIP